MEGSNFVSLVGKIVRAEFKQVGEKNTSLFKGRLEIPIGDGSKSQYLKISAWGNVAEMLNSVPQDQFIKIHGHIEERPYDGKCKHCGGKERRYWTDVVVDQFGVL